LPFSQKSTVLAFVTDFHGDDRSQCEDEARETIKEALKFMRNQLFEVPFIAFYRKELVSNVLSINDLWKVYEWDEKWCHLQNRKKKLVDLMKRMQYYQTESLQNYRRVVSDDDIIEVQNVDTVEALGDLSAQFHVYYGSEVGRMLDWEAAQKDIDEGGDGTNVHGTRFRQSTRNDRYQLCVDNGIGEMVARFGITARQLAENLDWKKHDVEQDPVAPKVAAADYTSSSFPTPETVIAGAIYMMARELSREPIARERIRSVYRSNVKTLCSSNTKRSRTSRRNKPRLEDEVKKNSRIVLVVSITGKFKTAVIVPRYVKGKPVSMLEEEEFLYYHQAKVAEHLEVKFMFEKDVDDSMVVRSLSDALLAEQPFRVDEYSEIVEEWNSIREKATRMAIDEMVLPFLEKELEEKLLDEAKESVLLKCAKAMYTRLEPAAFQPTEEQLEDEDEDVARQGEVRVMAIAYPTDFSEASFGVLVDQDGAVIDYCRMVHFLKRSGGFGPNQNLKAESMNFFKKFVERRRPHVIGLCGENLESIRLRRDLEECLNTMVSEGDISRAPPVYILDNEAAKVYMLSKGAIAEHSGYPPTLLQAISLARLLLDPLWEYAHLWNADEDIFCLNFHPLQSEISKDDLSNALSRELINRVNEVGVDVNRCLEHPHTANVLQFVCGLGPRKATHLLKMLKQHDHLLESRTKLVTLCRMGPKVFMNCAGFIKIDTTRVAEKTDAYVEVLDGSRVHPETYEWARKMAVDALEVDDSADPTTALEEILQAPDRLKDLDLDAFAEELKRQELFGLLTKESKITLMEEKRVCGVVIGVQFKRIPEDQRAAYISGQEHMQRIQESEYWECSFCRMPIISNKLYEHLQIKDSRKGGCPGIPVGIKVKLDNGINGFIPNKMISDKPESFKNPLERVKMNQPIYCRIIKLEPEKFSCLLSCRTSDLNKEPVAEHDTYWDYELEKEDIEKDRSAKSQKQQLQAECNFTHRQIVHPQFHNVSYREAQRMLGAKDTGDIIIRPSAKSNNRLTISWKVADGVVANIDVEEHDKEDPTELGRRLTILGEDFDDLDEAIARFLYPMADLCRDVMSYKYFMDGVFSEERDRIEARLRDEKRASPARIPYVLTASRTYPAKFVISYLARVKPCHEYISVTSEGLKFRQKFFSSLDALLAWFKVHFREPP
ncbi:S1 RNA binding domain protein, partial [Cooperia oncophora]